MKDKIVCSNRCDLVLFVCCLVFASSLTGFNCSLGSSNHNSGAILAKKSGGKSSDGISLDDSKNDKLDRYSSSILFQTKGYYISKMVNIINREIIGVELDIIIIKDDYTLTIESASSGKIKIIVHLKNLMLLCNDYLFVCSFNEAEKLYNDMSKNFLKSYNNNSSTSSVPENEFNTSNCILLLTEKDFQNYNNSRGICFSNYSETLRFKHILSRKVLKNITKNVSPYYQMKPLVFEEGISYRLENSNTSNTNTNDNKSIVSTRLKAQSNKSNNTTTLSNSNISLIIKDNYFYLTDSPKKYKFSDIENYFKTKTTVNNNSEQDNSTFAFTILDSHPIPDPNPTKQPSRLFRNNFSLKHRNFSYNSRANYIVNRHTQNILNLLLLKSKITEVVDTFRKKECQLRKRSYSDKCDYSRMRPLIDLARIKYYASSVELSELRNSGFIDGKSAGRSLAHRKEEVLLDVCCGDLLCKSTLVTCDGSYNVFEFEMRNFLLD